MKSCVAGVLCVLIASSLASAQTGSDAGKGYAEVVAQAAFGNVTSQSYGAEAGYEVVRRLQVFVDFGRTRDAAPSDVGLSAQTIASFLAQSQSNVSYTVRQPVSFGLTGVRYLMPTNGRAQPYIMGGFGLAKVLRDVRFSIAGSDVTTNLQQYGVVLGTDLSGSASSGMLTLGGGVVWPIWRHVIVDGQFRYGRVFAEEKGINISRAGLGLGVRF